MKTNALSAEFDSIAAWTADAVVELGSDYALPAACRGSGSPSALAWLAEAMGVKPGQRVLDAGAGVGGPSAWLRDHYRAEVIAVEPMVGATQACQTLFGLPVLTAWSQAIPLRSASMSACWSLGVLDTTPDRGSKRAMLEEIRRVLETGSALGLLVITREVDELVDPPEGNDFPTMDSLLDLLADTGFAPVQRLRTDSLSAAPLDWQAKADRVADRVADAHASDPSWINAAEQGRRIGRLLGDGSLGSWLIHATAY